jgi:flagellar protein FliO/FliZ
VIAAAFARTVGLSRARPRRAILLLAAAGAAAVVLAAPGAIGPAAARAALAVAGLGAAVVLLGRRRLGDRAAAAPELAVLGRAALGKDTGVALVEVGGRRLLLGFGPGGVMLLEASAGGAPEVAP